MHPRNLALLVRPAMLIPHSGNLTPGTICDRGSRMDGISESLEEPPKLPSKPLIESLIRLGRVEALVNWFEQNDPRLGALLRQEVPGDRDFRNLYVRQMERRINELMGQAIPESTPYVTYKLMLHKEGEWHLKTNIRVPPGSLVNAWLKDKESTGDWKA